MKPEELPVVGFVVGSGPPDGVFDFFLLSGPLVLAVLAVLGRRPVTVLLVVSYLGGLCSYVLYKGVRST